MTSYSSFMDKVLKDENEAFSVRFGPFEPIDGDLMDGIGCTTISPNDFSVVKASGSDKIDFGSESIDTSLKREDDSSYCSYERDLLVNDGTSKFNCGKNFPCPYGNCKKVYTSSYGLKYHMDHGHTAEKSNEKRPYVCDIENCGKTYKNNNGLKYHILHAHKGHVFNESDYFM